MQIFETPGSVSLQVKLPSGRVVVTTADEPRTSVEIVGVGRRAADALDEVEVTMDEHRGRHEIRIEQKDRFRWGPIQITWGGDIECRIVCPPGADLELSGGSTDLKVEGELGDVAARTASGDVRLDTARGEVQVKTASGDISVGTVSAEASLTTVSGELDVDRVAAALTARAVSGDVTLGRVSALVGLSTTSGDVDVKAVDGGDLRVQTVSGDVKIGVCRGTRVWIDAASVSGDLASDLGLEDQAHDDEQTGAVVPLQVKTVSGDVSVGRAAEAYSV